MRAISLSLGYGDTTGDVTLNGATAVYLHEAREARSKGDVVGVAWMLGTPAVGNGQAEIALAVGVPGIGDPAPAAVGAADITAGVQTASGSPSLATIVLAQDIAPGDGLFLIAAARGFSTPPRLVASIIVDLPGTGIISTHAAGYMPSENIGAAVTFESASFVHPFTAVVRW